MFASNDFASSLLVLNHLPSPGHPFCQGFLHPHGHGPAACLPGFCSRWASVSQPRFPPFPGPLMHAVGSKNKVRPGTPVCRNLTSQALGHAQSPSGMFSHRLHQLPFSSCVTPATLGLASRRDKGPQGARPPLRPLGSRKPGCFSHGNPSMDPAHSSRLAQPPQARLERCSHFYGCSLL